MDWEWMMRIGWRREAGWVCCERLAIYTPLLFLFFLLLTIMN